MAWRLTVTRLESPSGDFHKAIKAGIDMTIDDQGRILHKSDQEGDLEKSRGIFLGDNLFACLVNLPASSGAHDHIFVVSRSKRFLRKPRFVGTLLDVEAAAGIRTMSHNGTWHGVGR